MALIDTHAHLYLEEFDGDREASVQRALAGGVDKIFMPAVDSRTHEAMLRLESEFGGSCYAMMGLHPCSVREDLEAELKIAVGHLSSRDFLAIGETGLDFYWDLSFKEAQFVAFNRQIDWALEYDIPVVIHSRNSIDACIEVIAGRQKGNLKGVFHCFSGDVLQAKKIIDLGFYLGIGGVLTFKNSGLDKVMASLDLNQVILETDAPYLAPVPYRGKRNEPAYIQLVADKLAAIKGLSKDEVDETTTKNALKLFSGKLLQAS